MRSLNPPSVVRTVPPQSPLYTPPCTRSGKFSRRDVTEGTANHWRSWANDVQSPSIPDTIPEVHLSLSIRLKVNILYWQSGVLIVIVHSQPCSIMPEVFGKAEHAILVFCTCEDKFPGYCRSGVVQPCLGESVV